MIHSLISVTESTSIERRKNNVIGAVFGQAIGDAIGHPVEFKKTHYVVDLDIPNQFTDDTQMFCALGEALIEGKPHEMEDVFMDVLTKKFVEWRTNPLGGNHRAPGGTCMEGVRKLGAKVPWTKSGALNGKGNGTAMRSGVVGAMYWKNPNYAFRIGALQSVNTHNNLEAILGGGTVSYLVAAAINGMRFSIAISNVLMLCSQFLNPSVIATYPQNVAFNDLREGQSPWKTVAKFGSAFALGISDIQVGEFAKFNGDDFSVVPAVSAAIFYNTRFANSGYEQTVLNAANFGDDTDTIAAIRGTIAGAEHGVDGIPTSWVENIEQSEYLRDFSDRLWEASLAANVTVDNETPVDTDSLLDMDEIEF